MVVKELIQRVQALYSRGVESDDTRLRSRLIYNKLLSVRSKLLTQKINKKQKISSWDYQTLPCIELVKSKGHSCDLPSTTCGILVSKSKLPRPLQHLSGHLIKSVTTIDRQIKIDEIKNNQAIYLKGNKYTSNKPCYFIEDGFLYVTSLPKIRVVSLIGVFEDLEEVLDFNNESGKPMLDQEFPIDSGLIEPLIELTVQELISIFVQMKEDSKGNINED